MKEQIETLLAEIRASWRFRWHAIAAAWIIGIAGAVTVLLLPDRYESMAQVYVDTASILKPLLQGIAVSPNVENSVDVVRRAMLARPNLERVARKEGLLLRARTAEEIDRSIVDIGNTIRVTGDPRVSVYTISFEHSSARKAQAVVQDLLDGFVENSLGANRADSQVAQRFLKEQVATYEKRLAESEEQLANFKKQNVGIMPDQRGDYFNRLQSESLTLRRFETDYAVAVRQRDELRHKLVGDTSDDKPLQLPNEAQIQAATALDAQLQESRRQLDALLLRFTDKHPDVIALRETIQRLEERRRVELGRVRPTAAGSGPNGQPGVDLVMQNLQIQLNGADIQVATLSTQVAEAQKRVADLRRMLNTGPEVEAELARLNRDYGVIKAQYETLLQRLESARITDRADQSQEVKFKVLEPPRIPVTPTAPRRGLLLGGVLVLALLSGGALAYVLNLLHPVFMTPGVLAAQTGLPVLGVVSSFRNIVQAGAARRQRVALGGAVCGLVLFFVAAILVSHAGSRFIRNNLGLE
jgi:polysaccharide chain length determinant protein (PEP-CTERM system associated)